MDLFIYFQNDKFRIHKIYFWYSENKYFEKNNLKVILKEVK